MNKAAIILLVSLAISLQPVSALALFGEYPVPKAIHIKKAKPLSAKASYVKKFDQYKLAIDDNDFQRVITLFYDCANAGDAMCQFFLADGVSEWLDRDFVPRPKKYGPQFVRKWLRRSFEDYSSYGFVTMDWSDYYFSGAMGFPKDKQLSRCWGEVWDSNNDMSRKAVLARADACQKLEITKYGKSAKWLTQ
jgi:hypothetical protein